MKVAHLRSSLPQFVGVYRPQTDAPGFGIMIYGAENRFFVRSKPLAGTDFVFQEVAVDAEQLRHLSDATRFWSQDDKEVFAFEFPAGDVVVGTRESLSACFRGRLFELQQFPFVLAEVARFIGDKSLIRNADLLCKELLTPPSYIDAMLRTGSTRLALLAPAHRDHRTLLMREGWHPDNVVTLDKELSAERLTSELLPQLSQLSTLRQLDIVGHRIGAEGVLAITSHLQHLTSLGLVRCAIDAESAVAIGQMPNLTALNVSHNRLHVKGAVAIARSLKQLHSLKIGANTIHPDGAAAIAENLNQLQCLVIDSNDVGPTGADAISQHLPQLIELDIRHNRIGRKGARAIATRLQRLRTLDIGYNHIGPDGAVAIATSLPELAVLNIAANNIGRRGARVIARRLQHLTSLDIQANRVGAAGARAIGRLRHLKELNIAANDIGDSGVRAVVEALPELSQLNVAANGITEDGALSLQSLSKLTSADVGLNSVAYGVLADKDASSSPWTNSDDGTDDVVMRSDDVAAASTTDQRPALGSLLDFPTRWHRRRTKPLRKLMNALWAQILVVVFIGACVGLAVFGALGRNQEYKVKAAVFSAAGTVVFLVIANWWRRARHRW